MMLENWMIFNLLVSPGDGPHPYGESFAMMFIGIFLIGLFLGLLVLVIGEPILHIIRRKGKKVFFVSGLINGFTFLIVLILLIVFNHMIIFKLLTIIFVSGIQLFKVFLVKELNNAAFKISAIYTIIIEITYIIIILVLN